MSEVIRGVREQIFESIMYSRSVRCFNVNFGRVSSTDGILDSGLIIGPSEKQFLVGLLSDRLSKSELPNNKGAIIIDYEYDEKRVLVHGSVQIQIN